ncbi:tyrosine-type recombinase/integrase [Nocardia sp. IFM 10818]
MSTAVRSRTPKKKPTTPRPRVRKDGGITYQVRYRIDRGTGKPVQSSQPFADLESATKFARLLDTVGAVEAERILAAQQAAVSGSNVVTFVGWLRHYIDRLTGVEPETKKKYHRFVDLDIVPFYGEALPLEAVTQDMDAAWVVFLEEDRGNGPKTIANKHGFVSAAMSAAVRQRPEPLIKYNPCADTRLPTTYVSEFDIFTAEEFEFFEALLGPRWRAMFEFAVMSMTRPAEYTALTKGDINPKTGAVRVNKAWKWAGAKRKLGKPKSSRGVRTTYVPLETIARLDLTGDPDDLLFPNENGEPLMVSRIHQAWQPAIRRLEALATGDYSVFHGRGRGAWLGDSPEVLLARYGHLIDGLRAKRITPYITRHTGISWRLQDGVPIWVVSRDAGHESVQTTDKRYGHIDATASLAAAQKAAGRLSGLRRNVVDLELARRRRLARTGDLGEIYKSTEGYEAVWMSAEGIVQSQVFGTYEAAVEHVALNEAGDDELAAA